VNCLESSERCIFCLQICISETVGLNYILFLLVLYYFVKSLRTYFKGDLGVLKCDTEYSSESSYSLCYCYVITNLLTAVKRRIYQYRIWLYKLRSQL